MRLMVLALAISAILFSGSLCLHGFPVQDSGKSAAENERPKPAPGQRVRPAPRSGQNRTLLDRWQRMSPQLRQKALNRLPPERRQQFERRFEELDKLSSQEKNQLRKDYLRFRQLPPDQQNAMRRLYGRLNQLTPNRRQALTREYRGLRLLSPEQQQERLRSEEFRKKFGGHERRLLEEMTRLTPAEK